MSSQSLSADSEAGLEVIPRTTALVLVLAGFVTFVNMWCTQAILPVLAKSLHVSPALTGYTVTAPLVATAAMAPLVGAISDRFGRRVFIRGAALLLIIPTILAAFSTSLGMLIACRFAQGLLLPFIFTVTIAYIGDEMSPASAMRMVGIYTSGTISGGFSGRLIVGFVTALWNWRAGFLVIGLITLAAALIIAFKLPPEKRFKPTLGISGALHSFPNHLSNKRLLGTYAVGFGVLFSLVSVFTFINFRLAEAPYHLGPAALGSIFVVYLGGVMASPRRGPAGRKNEPAAVDGGLHRADPGRAGAHAGLAALGHLPGAAAGLFWRLSAADAGHGLYRRGRAGGEVNRRRALCHQLLYRRQLRRHHPRRRLAQRGLAGLRRHHGAGAARHAGLRVEKLAKLKDQAQKFLVQPASR